MLDGTVITDNCFSVTKYTCINNCMISCTLLLPLALTSLIHCYFLNVAVTLTSLFVSLLNATNALLLY